MSDLDALLAGIVADPTNELRWLVLADWLEDYDDPRRGELTRLHLQMRQTCTQPEQHPERDAWHARMMELMLSGVQPCVPTQTLMLPGDVELRLAYIPPGSFLMGSDNGASNEKPVHEVRLTKGFWLGVTPVTQEQWQAIMGNNPSFFKFLGPQNPVEQVSWDEAVQFCKAVQQKCGIELRLPTEAEWEYACRAGTTTDYYSGNGEGALRQVGWFDGNAGVSKPVGQLIANAWNIHDLHGNVWEWCSDFTDWYGDSYYAQSSKDDPQGPTSGSYRVHRGGGCCDAAESCRSAFRYWYSPDYRNGLIGFRLTRVPSGSE
jgi:uncharacterized protein (TIGR02996 family)